MQVINDPKSRDIDNINATENAISAYTKILKFNPSALTNLDELIGVWFSWLPISEDPEEATHIYGYLCDLIEANHQVILGANNCNLPRIVSIIAEAFCTKVLEVQSATGTRMLTIVKQVESNPEVMQACISTLSPEQQQALQDAYREVATAGTA